MHATAHLHLPRSAGGAETLPLLPCHRRTGQRAATAALLSLVAALLLLLLCPAARAELHAANPIFERLLKLWKPRPVASTDEVGSGELLWQSPDGLIPLPILDMSVDIRVAGLVAQGTVTQIFANPTDHVIDAIYVLPLPERSAVDGLELRIGSRQIAGKIMERQQAQATYANARATGRKAALLDQARPNLFTTSVANVNPGESVTVIVSFVDEVSYEAGAFSLAFPFTLTPRFTSAAADASAADRVSPPFASSSSGPAPKGIISVRIDAGVPLTEVTSDSHPIHAIERDGAWLVLPPAGDFLPDRDFTLRWRPRPGDEPTTALLTETRDGETYGLLMIVPPAWRPSGKSLAASTLFVIDTSGSMAGASIHLAKEALAAALHRLRATDRFGIVEFDDDTSTFGGSFYAATAANVASVSAWVARLEAGGGTNIRGALITALDLVAREANGGAVTQIVFLTDGAVSGEAAILAEIAPRLGSTRLHTIGIGSAPNRYLMRKMAQLGQGLSTFIAENETDVNPIDAFFARLDRPVWTDLALDWGIDVTAEVYPNPLPDLFAREPLVAAVRLRGAHDEVSVAVRGKSASASFALRVDSRPSAHTSTGIATRWARAKVEALLDSLHDGAAAGQVRADVISLATLFKLVTPYTSFVAVDETSTATGESREHRLANAVPAGMSHGMLPRGGTDAPLRLFAGLALLAVGLALTRSAR
ncbi:MAG: marine proteobacterial sortase target protein [Candidatus Schekmanbacteria bacterium]|nr:marine proteobacterial sortase target protein [Candidatus Schekmanbacteria bacterium]